MLVSKEKILNHIICGPPNGSSNVEISRKIIEESAEDYSLESVKVMVSRKLKDLMENGDVERTGRRYTATTKGLKRATGASSFLRRSYSLKDLFLSNIHTTFIVPPNPRGQSLYEDREIREALETIDRALEQDIDFTITIKPSLKKEEKEDK